MEYEDGAHKFFFEDEERGSLKLKYFVRLGDEFYEKVNLSDKKAELEEMVSRGAVVKVNDRCTEYGKYDRTVNNHWNE